MDFIGGLVMSFLGGGGGGMMGGGGGTGAAPAAVSAEPWPWGRVGKTAGVTAAVLGGGVACVYGGMHLASVPATAPSLVRTRKIIPEDAAAWLETFPALVEVLDRLVFFVHFDKSAFARLALASARAARFQYALYTEAVPWSGAARKMTRYVERIETELRSFRSGIKTYSRENFVDVQSELLELLSGLKENIMLEERIHREAESNVRASNIHPIAI